MKFTVEETGGDGFLTLPPDVIIQVMVESTEVREATNKAGETWKKLNFRFKITDIPDSLKDQYGVLVGSTIFGSVAARLTVHPDNKLRQWTEALLDMELDAGFELDTDMLIGRKARGVVGNWTRASDNTVNHQIVGLLPLAPAAVGSSGSNLFEDDEPPF